MYAPLKILYFVFPRKEKETQKERIYPSMTQWITQILEGLTGIWKRNKI